MKRMGKSVFSWGLLTALLSQYTILCAQSVSQGEFWKEQVLEKIIVPWTQHAIDQEYGAYHSYLERDWQPFNGSSKFPGMIARHLFSYAVAYMLSGEEAYRLQAEKTYDYLIDYGWDKQYGGWYSELNRQGAVVDASKDLFMQTYAITGLAMYYLMTKDREVKDYLDRSIRLLETNAWDSEGGGGYVRSLNQDLTIKNGDKVFSPQLAPLSGYLLYLYAATRDDAYLQMSERIIQTVLEKMSDEESGWIMEAYDRDWQLLPKGNEWMNTGHNVEVAWMLLRLYELTGKESYLRTASDLNERLLRYAFDPKIGIWYHKVKVADATQHSQDSPWWVQAYGNMFQLYMYHSSRQLACLQHFRKGAEFWNEHFIDKEYGGAFLSVNAVGKIDNGKKAVRTKTSYHSMEHGLLNYLYLDLWINQSEVQLFYFVEEADNDRLYPLPIEETDYEITEVQINGEEWQKINHQEDYVMLPSEKDLRVMVKLRKK